jgi:hypothetical protein
MPQRQHCPFEKRRGDRNPEWHEEQQKDVAWIHVAHPLKNAEKEHKYYEMLFTDITVRAQGARVSSTHAREATNSHQNSQAINQLSRQPTTFLNEWKWSGMKIEIVLYI